MLPESSRRDLRRERHRTSRSMFMFATPIRKASVAAALLAGLALAPTGGAQAQLFNRPPAGGQGDPYQGGAGDPAAMMLRIERLENQIRSLTGQLEEAQFTNRRLEDQVRRLQEAGVAGASDAPPRGGPPPQRRSDLSDPPMSAGGAGPRGRGDAFDPSQTPGAPGAPRVLGSMDRNGALSGPLGDPIIDEGPYGDPNAPLDLLNPRRPPQRTVAAPASAPMNAPLPQAAPLPAPQDNRRPPPRTQTATPVDPAPGAPRARCRRPARANSWTPRTRRCARASSTGPKAATRNSCSAIPPAVLPRKRHSIWATSLLGAAGIARPPSNS